MKLRFPVFLTSLLLILSFFASHHASTSIANPLDELDFEFWIAENQTAFMTVTFTFYDAGYNLTGWETIGWDSSNFSGAVHFGDVEGDYFAQVICYESHNFSLGQLDEGVYTFTLLLVDDDFPHWYQFRESTVFEVGFPADVNDDGKVDIKDIAIVALAYGTHNPDPRYNPAADIYYDGKVDIRDVAFTAMHYGE